MSDAPNEDGELGRTETHRLLLRVLRVNGPCARVDLGALTGFSPATVTTVTGELARDGLIQEAQGISNGSAQRGRPRVMLDLTAEAAHVICVKISINTFTLLLGDFKGRLVVAEDVAVDTRIMNEQAIVDALARHITAFRKRHAAGRGRFLGIGIACQGVVDMDRGHVRWSPALTLLDLPLVEPLRARFGCPVALLNDVACIAIAVRAMPEYQDLTDFAVIMLGYGVGMALVLGGRPYYGPTGAAAEFGHSKYALDGPLCLCGRRGCVEAYVGDYALYRDAQPVLDLPHADFSHPSEAQMQRLVDHARRGHAAALGLFAQAGRVLGFGLVNLVALLNPQVVFITGSGVRAYSFMEAALKTTMREAIVDDLRVRTSIVPIAWRQDLTALGIVAQALDPSMANLPSHAPARPVGA